MTKRVGYDYKFRYATFPDYNVEEVELKLEAWLYKIWNGENPIELLWESIDGLYDKT